MKSATVLLHATFLLAASGLIWQPFALAAGPATTREINPSVVISDVALHEGGMLLAQVSNVCHTPEDRLTVDVLQRRNLIARSQTDSQGRVAIRGLKTGVYEIATAKGSGFYRLWSADAVPPSARSVALLTTVKGVVRGQDPCHDAVAYKPALLRAAVAGGLLTGGVYWALDYNADGS